MLFELLDIADTFGKKFVDERMKIRWRRFSAAWIITLLPFIPALLEIFVASVPSTSLAAPIFFILGALALLTMGSVTLAIIGSQRIKRWKERSNVSSDSA